MRSLLFVPADQPAKLEKSLASGANVVIVDLEDSVAADAKAKGRETMATFLGAHAAAALYHMRMFGLTLIVIPIITYFLLYYAYISFFCFLAAAGTIHLIYIILGDKCCAKYCPAPIQGGLYEKR